MIPKIWVEAQYQEKIKAESTRKDNNSYSRPIRDKKIICLKHLVKRV